MNPLPILIIIIMTLTFQGLLFGQEIAERTFTGFQEPTGGGFFGALEALLAVVQAVWGAILFFLNLLFFNVPGAPWWIRLPIGTALTGGLIWSIATLVRGGGGGS
jgi:hypothetical protein